MIPGIAKEERYEFISSLDTTEPKTVFVIGNIPARLKIKFAQAALTQDSQNTGKFQFTGDIVDVVLAGLKEIRCGDIVITELTDEVLGRIPMDVLIELVGKIFSVNSVSADEKKN